MDSEAFMGSGTEHAGFAAGKTATRGRVLLAEDDPALLKMIDRKLTNFGFSVTCAPNGGKALELFLSAPETFDLLLTDREMPGMSGEELCRRVTEARPSLPVIIATGNPYMEPSAKGAKAPYSCVLSKPFSLDSLVAAVSSELTK